MIGKYRPVEIQTNGLFYWLYAWYINFRQIDTSRESRCNFRKIAWFKAPYQLYFHANLFSIGNWSFRPVTLVWIIFSLALGLTMYLMHFPLWEYLLVATYCLSGALIAPLFADERTAKSQDATKYSLAIGPMAFGILIFVVPPVVIIFGFHDLTERIGFMKPFWAVAKYFFRFLAWKPTEKGMAVWHVVFLSAIAWCVYKFQNIWETVLENAASKVQRAAPGLAIVFVFFIGTLILLWLTKLGSKMLRATGQYIDNKAHEPRQDIITMTCGWMYDVYRGICPYVTFVPKKRRR